MKVRTQKIDDGAACGQMLYGKGPEIRPTAQGLIFLKIPMLYSFFRGPQNPIHRSPVHEVVEDGENLFFFLNFGNIVTEHYTIMLSFQQAHNFHSVCRASSSEGGTRCEVPPSVFLSQSCLANDGDAISVEDHARGGLVSPC